MTLLELCAAHRLYLTCSQPDTGIGWDGMGILDATRSIRRQGVPRGVNRHSKLARSRYLGKINTGVEFTTNAMA